MSEIYRDPGESIEKVFQRIEDAGGFPDGLPFLTSIHGVGTRRMMCFTSHAVRDEWNTTIATRDEYLWWLISDDFKDRAIARAITVYQRKLNVAADGITVRASE